MLTTCLSCGQNFERSRANQKFCSNACRQKNYRLNEPQKKPDNQQVENLVNQALALCEQNDVSPIYVAAHLVYRETKEKLMKLPVGLRNKVMTQLIDEVLMKS